MPSKSEAYTLIEELVIRFNEQIDSYKSGQYNETLTRRDFIDPFFKALGWDIDNSQGYAEAYREVIHEDKVKIGRATKAPDYSFRLGGGKRLFFVEAKKPSIDVKGDITVAYQIRRYGWSAKLPVSIITDFEEFAVYDCTKKPNPSDRTGVARIKYLRFDKYLAEFDYLWNTFSKEQVLKGSFDRYVQKDTVKKGTATVDKEFLISLDTWRTYLATSISIKNKQLDEDEINFAVQMTIDRLIFLRIAEDRGVEAYGQLKASVNLKGDAYQNLFFNFKRADEKYNSGIFDFKKDVISENLVIDSKVIKTIISEMYYPVSPYEFSVLSVEILGSAYEQFLGKQIKIDEGHRAKIEDKPEVRKAGGVYYTPQYVVDYIVKNTVGKLIDGKTPKQIADIKIVDPACGSGIFLIGAYQYLIDFHKNYYTDNGTRTGKKDSLVTAEGNLTSAEKKRILLNNIYGVDIDVNAVEVTKLSLLLKCLEGETETSLTQQFQLWHERILPTLDENIKSGNSLVDMDYYEGMLDLDLSVEKRVKPFSWLRAFPEVFKLKIPTVNPDFKKQFNRVVNLNDTTNNLIKKYNVNEPSQDYKLSSGFDIIIGNPPYGATFSTEESSYFRLKYNTSVWRVESYLLFIEQAMKLLKPDGFMGFIIPDTLLNLKFTQPARELLLRNSQIQEVVGLPSNVFEGATVDTIILLTEKADYNSKFHPGSVLVKSFGKKQNISVVENPQKEFFIKTIEWFEQDAFNLQADETEKELLSKVETGRQEIADIAEMYSGIKAYEVGKGKPIQTVQIRDEKPYTSKEKADEKWFPFFDGKHIGRYQLLWSKNNWIKYGGWLAAPRNQENFEGEKILIRKITGKTLIATYIADTSYCNTLLFVLKIKEKSYSYPSVLGVLNSDLIGWYFRNKFQISDEDSFPQIMIRDILQFPFPVINQLHDAELNGLVAQILQLNIEKSEAKLPAKIEYLVSKIEYCESRINNIVYQLYELTEEEIKIVKGK